MQAEFDTDYADLGIQIIGVNEVGFEPYNDVITQDRDLPWLQETVDDPVWSDWAVTYRDVVALDADNHPYGVYNLTTRDLAIPENYEDMRSLLLAAAGIE